MEEDSQELLPLEVNSPRSRNKFKKGVFKFIPVLSLVLIIVGIVLLIVLMVLSQRREEMNKPEIPPTVNHDFPQAWKDLGQQTISMMDFSADPCSDFYQVFLIFVSLIYSPLLK